MSSKHAQYENHDKENHSEDNGHAHNHDHSDHEHLSPGVFRDRFWVSFALTLPILYLTEQIQQWIGSVMKPFRFRVMNGWRRYSGRYCSFTAVGLLLTSAVVAIYMSTSVIIVAVNAMLMRRAMLS